MSQKLGYFSDNFHPLVGVVEQVIDEAYVRVRCFGIHPLDKTKVRTDQLPPALVLYPTTGGQVGGGSLTHNLEVDSWVFGYFVDYPLCMQPIITHSIQGTSYSMSTYSSQGGEFVGQGNGTSVSTDGGYAPPVDTGATTNIPGGSNTEKVYNYIYGKLVAEGSSSDPHLHTSAALGVMEVESPGHRPEVVGGYKGRAWGICQWLDPRRKQLFDRYGPTKRLDQQLDFMWWELNNTERPAKSKWLRTSNIVEATAGFNSFERADDCPRGVTIRSHPIFKRRLQNSYKFYNSMKYSGNTKTNIASPQSRGDA